MARPRHCSGYCQHGFGGALSNYFALSGSTASGVLITAIKAEAVVVVMFTLLWLVMTLYKDGCSGIHRTFVLTVIIWYGIIRNDEAKVTQNINGLNR
jgi:ATP synthase protein I